MNSNYLTVALATAFHCLASSDARAGILYDGDFSAWSFGATGTASVVREASGGNLGARLNITTISGAEVYGTAVKTDYSTSVGFAGDPFSLSLDVKSGPGSFGDGQRILLLVEQSGTIYGKSLANTDYPHNWDTLTFTGAFNAAEFPRLLGPGPSLPNFNGAPTSFGFAGGNANSATLTQYYDNFQLDSPAVPEPSCIGSVIAGIAVLGMRRGRFASAMKCRIDRPA